MRRNGVILIGLGPHARRIYYPFLEKYAAAYDLFIPLIVDLAGQQEIIEAYLAKRPLQPEKQLYLDHNADFEHNPSLINSLLSQETLQQCHSIIISSEAKTHQTYITWALENNLDILTDKPIISPCHVSTNTKAAESIWGNYLTLENALNDSTSNFIVQCQRRSHEGYQFIRNYLDQFIQEFKIPISFVDIYHSDGMWPMPSELFERENHPYKYGYGKLMHSGYHFIDLFAWLTALNETIEEKTANNMDLFVQTFRPTDFLFQVDQKNYNHLFKTNQFQNHFSTEVTQQLGELDAFIQCQMKREHRVVTTGSINLQQNSFSRRAWITEAKDVYKGNGRIRHERVNIQVANLLNIQVHSYQSYEIGKGDNKIPAGEAGHEAHFDIHIYRNSELIGGNVYQKLQIGKSAWERYQNDSSYLGHNEQAREKIFMDFINGRPSDSHFSTHKKTNLLLSNIYKCIAQAHHKQIPFTQFAL